ncbi:hypothetical protein HPP92_026846 [Vanilla planifolia]|uniref:Chloride channel protein n=1 Tax=Vanilla planifolia TaxID=51239 RepID=A0A835U6W4_VANPL|nr:hypothetical protein HPP92_026846 [Vanilla planifolia]
MWWIRNMRCMAFLGIFCCHLNQIPVFQRPYTRRDHRRRLVDRPSYCPSYSPPLYNRFLRRRGASVIWVVEPSGELVTAAEEKQEDKENEVGNEGGAFVSRETATAREYLGELLGDARYGVLRAIEEALPDKDLVMLASCVVGLLTGVGVVFFNQAVHELRDLFWDGIPSRGASWLREEPLEEIWQRVILVPTCGGIIVVILNSLRNQLERSSWRTKFFDASTVLSAFFKAIAASITLGNGNSLGPEGPSVEIGSSIAKAVSNVFKWNAGKRLSIVAAGSAAGISSGFNAAVSGCFFAVESVLRLSSSDSFSSLTNSTSMVILSSVIASIVSEVGLGSDPTFTVPEYDFRSPSELPLYLLLGILCGLVALILSKSTSVAMEVAGKLEMAVGNLKALFPALGGLTVGLIALAYPEVLYWGFQNVDIVLESRPFVNGLPAGVLFQLVGAKILATSICRASGLVGGYYAPSLFIGAATGMAYGKFVGFMFSGPNPLIRLPILDVASPQAYGLVGMAATLAGVCQVPLTSVLLLFELTQDYRIVLPLLGAVGLSSWISSNQDRRNSRHESRKVEDGGNEHQVSTYCGEESDYSLVTAELVHDRPLCDLEQSLCVYDHSAVMAYIAERLLVAQAMRTSFITAQMSTTIDEVLKLMLMEKQSYVLITDSNGFLLGQLSLENIQNYSEAAQLHVVKTGVENVLISDVYHSELNKRLMWKATPNMTLATAERIMDLHGLSQLPVVSENVQLQDGGCLIGLLDKECISVTCRALATKEMLRLSSTSQKKG